MNETHYAVENLILLAALWALWQFGFRSYFLDYHRQLLFELRDDLFDAAASGQAGLSFSSPAYRAMERRLNNNIRFLHQTSPFVLLMAIHHFFKGCGDEAAVLRAGVERELASAQSGDEAQRFLNGISSRLDEIRRRYMWRASPLMHLVLVLYVLYNHRRFGIEPHFRAASEAVLRQDDRVIRLQKAVENRRPIPCAA